MHHSPTIGGVTHNQFQMENIGFPRCRTTSKDGGEIVRTEKKNKKYAIPINEGHTQSSHPVGTFHQLHLQYFIINIIPKEQSRENRNVPLYIIIISLSPNL
ncbi:hypothetical protein AVEN_37292-1 [Araneus ventricosus]|uniref:Uncharacterized protein n=1 Tax=Araneus ventricosus TaxID=182803 RepID=A0A4Y2KFH8_ARAVE|nr:hypothetical protein AVEN_37292-1 [Araneus ventricosus]